MESLFLILINMKAADIKLTQDEVTSIDEMLAHMPMSEVFVGSKIQKKDTICR